MRPFGKFNRASEDCTAALLWCFTIQPGEKVQLWFENIFSTWQALIVGIHWSGRAEKLNRMKLCSAARCKTKAFLKLPKCCCSLEVNFGKAQKRIFKRGSFGGGRRRFFSWHHRRKTQTGREASTLAAPKEAVKFKLPARLRPSKKPPGSKANKRFGLGNSIFWSYLLPQQILVEQGRELMSIFPPKTAQEPRLLPPFPRQGHSRKANEFQGWWNFRPKWL